MANSARSKFGDVRALSGEHNPSGSVVHRQDELSRLSTGRYRPPHLRIDVVKGVEGGSKRRGVVIKTQHLHCAPHRRCPNPGTHDAARVGTRGVLSS